MGSGGGDGGGGDDVIGAANVQAEAARKAAQVETHANRPDQYGPQASTTWSSQMVDANTGEPLTQINDGRWVSTDWYENQGGKESLGTWMPDIRHDKGGGYTGYNPGTAPGGTHPRAAGNEMAQLLIESGELTPNFDGSPAGGKVYNNPVEKWEQNTVLNPEWQAIVDQQRGTISAQQDYRTDRTNQWNANPVNFGNAGGANLQNTISKSDAENYGVQSANMGAQDWRQFGTTSPNMGAQDWRQFGTTEQTTGAQDWRQFGTSDPTIGADQWQNQGNSDPTLGADDWRQFGTSDPTLDGGTWDSRFGSADQSGGFGDHSMDGGGWDQIQYAPEAIRNKAEQQTLAFMNSQLDPQWDNKQADLETKLYNQGLQPGDAAFDRAMESQKTSRSGAYSGARNQALADSRAEANMLWGQEMSRSEQKNMQHQADIDNIYRARQSNIQNYQGQRTQDMNSYLNYQNSAFDQDFQSRNQQLQADLDYGNSAFQQDFDSRQQSLNAQLDYGRESWQQDFGNRQQQLDANRMYGQQAYDQDYQSRQQQLDANRLYSSEAFNQDLNSRQQAYDVNRMYSQEAFDQDYRSRQANITNALNYGNAEFGQNLSAQQLELQRLRDQEQAEQGRYALSDPGASYAALDSALNG